MISLHLVEPGRPLERRTVSAPEPGRGEIRVRVEAAGICHSDAHYRAGTSPVSSLPLIPGHEVAGIVEKDGPDATQHRVGDRVALHYLVTCRTCDACMSGREQFCRSGKMIGKHRDGGYAEFIVVPEQNAIPIPASVTFGAAAIMMCSSATSFHALNLAHRAPGESVAVFGAGGLGMSAVQLARLLGAVAVFAIDTDPNKLDMARRFGAMPVSASEDDVVTRILHETGGRGVDIAVETVGLPSVQQQAVRALAPGGRAALVGITRDSFTIGSYNELINKEAHILGVSDHLRSELVTLMQYAARGELELESVITERVPLDAAAVNAVLDRLQAFHGSTRAVIVPAI